MLNIMFVAEAVGAGAASHYGSGFTKMMLLLAAPTLQHCFLGCPYNSLHNNSLHHNSLLHNSLLQHFDTVTIRYYE
jgi:hypothetical protein